MWAIPYVLIMIIGGAVMGTLAQYKSGSDLPTLSTLHATILMGMNSLPPWLIGALVPVAVIWAFFSIVIGLNELDSKGGRIFAISFFVPFTFLVYSMITIEGYPR